MGNGELGNHMLSAEDIIRGGSLPTKSVPICMHADLTAEHEELERQLALARNAPRDSLASGSNATELSQRIEALQERMREHTVTFVLTALARPAWKKLIAEHPPRQDAAGDVDERDKYIGVNRDTFFEAMVRACVTEPDLSDELWDLLLNEKLTDAQFEALSDAAWALNRRDVDIPFSSAASTTPSSAPR